MGLIQKLKSALGLDGAGSPDSGTATPRDVDVTIEREPSAESEDAVKGTETASSGATGDEEPDAETAVGADTESSGTEPSSTGDASTDELPIEEAETAADASTDDAGTDEAASEPATDESADEVDWADVEEEGTADAAGEPDADAETESGVEAESDDEADVASGDEDSTSADATDEPAAGSSDPVTDINGIGAAYGERLSDAGVETVADLAAADADELADATDISASRIEGWIDAAAEY